MASSGTSKSQFWQREFSSSFVLYDVTQSISLQPIRGLLEGRGKAESTSSGLRLNLMTPWLQCEICTTNPWTIKPLPSSNRVESPPPLISQVKCKPTLSFSIQLVDSAFKKNYHNRGKLFLEKLLIGEVPFKCEYWNFYLYTT